MRRIRSFRAGQRLPHAESRVPDLGRCYRPRLECLEERIQPGHTLLGISAVALWACLRWATSDPAADSFVASTKATLAGTWGG